MDDSVDNVCRHAGHVVRRLGTELWRRSPGSPECAYEQAKRDPPGVWKKNFAEVFPPGNPQELSTGRGRQPVENEAGRSTPAGTAELIAFDGVFD